VLAHICLTDNTNYDGESPQPSSTIPSKHIEHKQKMKQFCFPLSVLYNDYSAFNPTIAHLTTKG
jgi:hypothetical protein